MIQLQKDGITLSIFTMILVMFHCENQFLSLNHAMWVKSKTEINVDSDKLEQY